MNGIRVDVMTGERTTVPLTQAELEAIAAAASVPPPVPKAVTMRQARLALLSAGLLSQVEAAITAAGDAARIEWEYAATVERNWPLVTALAAALGLTSSQVDELFFAASAL